MDFEEQIELNHLLLTERKCNKCGRTKNLVDGFYRTRKDRGPVRSSYSYECKECTIKRVSKSRVEKPDIPYDPVPRIKDIYPDW
tara:strand:+ start:1102 stop:1353 length:252 start_codon:yes stop_codon:yes gene_type:complete